MLTTNMGKKKETKIWDRFTSIENCRRAILNACKNHHTWEAKWISDPERIDDYAERLSVLLREEKYEPAPVATRQMKTEYGKVREIATAPLFPDCCVAHALANIMLPRWIKAYTDDSYACIPERGINSRHRRWNMNRKIRRVMAKYYNKTLVAAILDILGCYANVDHLKLYHLNRKYCREGRILDLIEKMIHSAENGLLIGLYFSQLQINVILTQLDRYVKQVLGVKYYFRFMDDILILSEDKRQLHEWTWRIRNFLWYELGFEVNRKRQVFPVGECRDKRSRAPDFGGYVYWRHHTRIRKRIKKSFINKRDKPKSVASYYGLLKHCDARHLMVKTLGKKHPLMVKLSDIGVKVERPYEGERLTMEAAVDKPIVIINYDIYPSKRDEGEKWLRMQVVFEGEKRYMSGGYKALIGVLEQIDKNSLAGEDGKFELETIIRKKHGYYFEGTLEL